MSSTKMGFNSISDDPKWWYITKKATEEVHKVLLDASLEYMSKIGDPVYDRAENYPGQVGKVLHFFLPELFREFIKDTLKEYRPKIDSSYYRGLSHIDIDKDIRFGIPNKFGYGVDGEHGRLIFRNRFEYTPLHINYGTLHFTYWIKVPYTQIQEGLSAPNPKPEHNIPDDMSTHNGSMYFAFPNKFKGDNNYETGRVDTNFIHLYTSKNSEGLLCIYPNYLMNGYNPFYSSKEYMIECTGPITFEKPITLI